MTHVRKRITYANVMSSIAVLLALGGATAYAASLGKNSVGTKQLKKNAVTAAKIKKNAVTTAKVKDDAVTGAKVNESTLGTVPSATLASSLTPHEAVHLVGAPGEPGFENGAANITVSGEVPLIPLGFYKDHEGIVHLQGIAKVGKNPSGVPTVFTLPAGFRPPAGHAAIFEMLNQAPAIIFGGSSNFAGFELSGKVAGNEEKTIVLEGITYSAES
jgi:hypothetical protein